MSGEPDPSRFSRIAGPARVVKLGGSLLLWPELPSAWRAWCASERAAAATPALDATPAIGGAGASVTPKTLLIVGGGPFADAVRSADEAHHLSPRRAHDLAIAAMSLSARLAESLLDDVVRLDGPAALVEWMAQPSGPVGMLDLDAFNAPLAGSTLAESSLVESLCRTLDRLPPSWDLTSDSLAAAVAEAFGIQELVLLKSDYAAPGASLEALAATGYVDRYFPLAAKGLAVRVVNLRSAAIQRSENKTVARPPAAISFRMK